MSDRFRQQWERLGAADPYWAVLSHPGKRGGRWERDEFFLTGRREIDELWDRFAALGLAPSPAVALDFGCGVGRLTRALAERCDRVIGCDVSAAMLTEAEAANADRPGLEFVRNGPTDLAVVPDETVDLVVSNIVLQHMSAARQEAFLREFRRVLKPGGLLVFQTPSAPNRRRPKAWLHVLLGNRILNLVRAAVHGRDAVMELHTLRRDRVLAVLAEQRMDVLATDRYDSAGRTFISFRYIVRRD